jgi:hypothetical protein
MLGQRVKKSYLYLVAMGVVICLCYLLAVKPTISAFQHNRELNNEVNNVALGHQSGYQVRISLNQSKIIARYTSDTVGFRTMLVSRVAEIADKEHVKIIGVPVEIKQQLKHYNLQKLVLKGRFFALTKVIDEVQHTMGLGYVRSAVLATEYRPELNKRSDEVDLDLFLEIIIK